MSCPALSWLAPACRLYGPMGHCTVLTSLSSCLKVCWWMAMWVCPCQQQATKYFYWASWRLLDLVLTFTVLATRLHDKADAKPTHLIFCFRREVHQVAVYHLVISRMCPLLVSECMIFGGPSVFGRWLARAVAAKTFLTLARVWWDIFTMRLEALHFKIA
jgi:hypothetical protein